MGWPGVGAGPIFGTHVKPTPMSRVWWVFLTYVIFLIPLLVYILCCIYFHFERPKFPSLTMAPAQPKLTTPLITQHDIKRKRKASYKITDKNFVGAESNAVTKRLKLSADATQATAAMKQQRQPSVKDTDNEDSLNSISSSPKTPNTVLEAADRSDGVTVETLDSDEDGSESKDLDEDDDLVITKAVETAKEQCRESNKTSRENKQPLT
jgi:hypothetical protein